MATPLPLDLNGGMEEGQKDAQDAQEAQYGGAPDGAASEAPHMLEQHTGRAPNPASKGVFGGHSKVGDIPYKEVSSVVLNPLSPSNTATDREVGDSGRQTQASRGTPDGGGEGDFEEQLEERANPIHPEPSKPGIWKMRSRYDLEAGKVRCRCLIRKWCFCSKIKDLADGKVSPNLVKTWTLSETLEPRETDPRDRQPELVLTLETLTDLIAETDKVQRDTQITKAPEEEVKSSRSRTFRKAKRTSKPSEDLNQVVKQVSPQTGDRSPETGDRPRQPKRKANFQISRTDSPKRIQSVKPKSQKVTESATKSLSLRSSPDLKRKRGRPTKSLSLRSSPDLKWKRGRPTKSLSLRSSPQQLGRLNEFWKMNNFVKKQSLP